MKNVLLTTTALVAFAGTAFAAAHEGGPNVTFSGSGEVKYNTDTSGNNGSISWGADFDIAASVALNNGVTAGVDYGFTVGDGTSGIYGDYYPVIWIESSYGRLSAGNADAIGPASDHFSETDGVSGFSDGRYGEDYYFAVRADIAFSGIDFSVSTADVTETYGTNEDLRVGASGSFGNFDFGMGYGVDVWGDTELGLNVGTTFGAVEVDFSVFDSSASGTDYGIQLAYTINPMMVVGGYFASVNDATDQEYGISLDYTSGPLTVGVGYDDGSAMTGNAYIDVEYAMAGPSAGATLYVGYDQAGGVYLGAIYELGAGATAWISYSEFDESGSPEFDDGITIGVGFEF